ncbi:MAG: M48 family metallopeptidase, partial [Candidatus Nitrosocosmicus sp.]|nr:M48 family metallopeptidase [Candidatus Nitrosocosmicus sp.]
MSINEPDQHEQHYSSKQHFQYGNKIVEYNLIKSKRRKTSEIIVKKDGITLRVPLEKTTNEIENILHDKIKWITIKQKELKEEKNEIIKPTYEDRSTLPYLGLNYELRIEVNSESGTERLEFKEDQFIVYLRSNSLGQENGIKNLYLNWLREMANKIFKDKVYEYSKTIGVNPKQVVLKNLKNRWGSLSKNQTVNLNVNLIKTPNEVIDYIIIHELCHFKIKGHSYQYW